MSCSFHSGLRSGCKPSSRNHSAASRTVREMLQDSEGGASALDSDCVQLVSFRGLCPGQTQIFHVLFLVPFVCNCIPEYLVHKDHFYNPCIPGDHHNIVIHSSLLGKFPILNKILSLELDSPVWNPQDMCLEYGHSHNMYDLGYSHKIPFVLLCQRQKKNVLVFCFLVTDTLIIHVQLQRPASKTLCHYLIIRTGLPSWLSGKEPTCQCKRHGFDPSSKTRKEKEMATHSSILAWEIPQTEEPNRL